MDKERGFEELVPPEGISEAEEDKRTEGGRGENKQIKTIATFFPATKTKTITIFKKKKTS